MRILFPIVQMFATIALITACSVSVEKPKVDVPDVKVDPETQKILNILGCSKSEAEMNISQAAQDNKVIAKDKVENQDFESKACDGKITTGHGPVRNVNTRVQISPPALSGEVAFIRIENQRTCVNATMTADRGTEQNEFTEQLNKTMSRVLKNGDLNLILSDSLLQVDYYVKVADGANPLKISYFGACQKYAAGKEETKYSSDCEVADLLGTKEVLVQMEVERPEIEGVRKIDTCTK